MSADFKTSETAKNLMRAFAGESQARNRYTFAADCAKKHQLYVVAAVFDFTANQEKEHARIFFNHLKPLLGQSVQIDGGYPAEPYDDVLKHLQSAAHNEYEEYDPVYKDFANAASQEGFEAVAASFNMISKIEKAHGDRFKMLAELTEQDKLFISDTEESWLCLNCGQIHHGTAAPARCPVCNEAQGYFVRLSLAPYTLTH